MLVKAIFHALCNRIGLQDVLASDVECWHCGFQEAQPVAHDGIRRKVYITQTFFF